MPDAVYAARTIDVPERPRNPANEIPLSDSACGLESITFVLLGPPPDHGRAEEPGPRLIFCGHIASYTVAVVDERGLQQSKKNLRMIPLRPVDTHALALNDARSPELLANTLFHKSTPILPWNFRRE